MKFLLNFLGTVSLYFHTIKFLKPLQIVNRLSRQFDVISVEFPSEVFKRRTVERVKFFKLHPSSVTEDGKLQVLNVIIDKSDWYTPQKEKLNDYNRHYFDWFSSKENQLELVDKKQEIINWINHNHDFSGLGWEPYPMSLRIVNWIKYLVEAQEINHVIFNSLFLQTKVLAKRIELHLLGNHLFANAKAIFFSALFFSGSEAEKWMQNSMKILMDEIDEQILPDGGHFELSPMYHSCILLDILEIILFCRSYRMEDTLNLEQKLEVKASSMLNWLDLMTSSDGSISHFNDSANSVYPNYADIMEFAEFLDIKGEKITKCEINPLQDSGYIVALTEHSKLIMDVGHIGASYIPGHAHADTLSFELNLFGNKFIVNSGTSTYEPGKQRSWERSTAAHNTVVVDSKNSSKVWGVFRVARRANPINLSVDKDRKVICCSHDGYKSFTKKTVHKRCWKLLDKKLVIEDEIENQLDSAVGYLHFAPIWKLEKQGKKIICRNDSFTVNVSVRYADIEIFDGMYSSEFNKLENNQNLKLTFHDNKCEIQFAW